MEWLIRLKEMKKQSGLTTKKISELSGLPEPTLEKIFAGQTKDPKLNTIRSVVHCLGYTLDDLSPAAKSTSAAADTETEELSEDTQQLLANYSKLNNEGKAIARDAVEALTCLPKYKKCDSSQELA